MLSYASTYVEADRAAARFLTDPTYKVLHNLVSRADQYGICWPGIRTIAEDTGKSKDTVQEALDELEATGCIVYIRRNGRDPISKQKLPNVYQINPQLYAVRPGLQAQAEACWNEHGGKPLSFAFPSMRLNQSKTNDSKPKLGTSYLHQQQQDPSESEGSLSFTPLPLPIGQEEEKTDEYVKQHRATHDPERRLGSEAGQQRSRNQMFRRSNIEASNRDAGYLSVAYPEIQRVAEELPNRVDEWLADRARHETGMSIRFARGLILAFSAPKVEAALNDKSLRHSTNIRNKAGFVFWLLANNLVEMNTETYRTGRPDDPDGSRYISGEYADFVEH